MKKQFAIFALSVFFFAQFGKVINFCLCSVAVYQQTKTFICDCEKQLYTAVKTDHSTKEQLPQNISAHQSTEELFHVSAVASFTIAPVAIATAWPVNNTEALYHIFANSIFHPPLGIAAI